MAGRSFDVLDGQPRASPGDEAACNLGRAVAQRRFRSYGMLAEVDSALALGLENVTRQRYRNRTGGSAVAAALKFRAEVKQPRVSSLQECPNLLRVD